MSEQSFDSILNDSVAEALSQMGDDIRDTILFCLEKTFKIKTEDIPRKPGEFDDAMGALLGSGANPLEDLIVRKLSAKIDVKITLNVEGPNTHFAEVVERAAELYRSKPKNGQVQA